MSTSTFTNISDKPFQGSWNGSKSRVFQPGQSMLMETYLAEAYAKHLVNQMLGAQGKHIHQSPKNPSDDPVFWALFSKACTGEDTTVDETPEGISNQVAEAEQAVKKGRKPAKKAEKKSDEEDFEGLDG